MIVSYLIPNRPLLYRGEEPERRFPVAGAMRDLCRVSLTSASLQRVVVQLRQDEEHAAYRDQASQEEFELGERSAEARCAARQRYAVDPVRPEGPPALLRLGAFSPEQWPQLYGQIAANVAELRELRLNLRAACAAQAPQLAAILPTCTALQRLSLSSNASLPQVFGTAGLPPALRQLRLQAPQLAPQWRNLLADVPFPAALQSLALAIPGLTGAELEALSAGTPRLQQLRMLTVSDGLTTLDNCAALAKVIGNLALLRLELGQDGGLCSAGAKVLVAAVCAHPTLKRLGLHRVADPDVAQELFTTLKHRSHMQELAYSGRLKAEGFAALCELVTGKPGLNALTLDGCALGSEQMRELACMVATNRLRELCISSQAFSDTDAATLASAIGASTGLLSLGFRNCAISPEPQARALARGVAKSKSLLSLELHFSDDAVGDRESVARNFVLGAGKSDTLVHFDLQGARCPGWAQAQEKLKQNRLR